MPYYSGQLQRRGSVAYVEQEPILFSDTIRNNITFGKPFDNNLYERVVTVSCLQSDFVILAAGDQTIVGEKGATLSGGQKARVALARALYANADIYLMDDPISAVDSRVAKKIFEKCLKPLSQIKTVLLVTHQLDYILRCGEAIIL